ncbi:MAG: trypsin-like serine protease [Bosea sp.]|uniref:trypsin-like serine protease n=1 Tax=Bosea sp. (in: a-proteobacteria) TaxID=1871050 RepID=UPI001AC2F255|nr:trypsin-like serine protease [Bosea sp. (in: a-proteobacteria)]MBN9451753.1 trypsin-like serine protease [Bosea sp. (in: a-proteobacteria)]
MMRWCGIFLSFLAAALLAAAAAHAQGFDRATGKQVSDLFNSRTGTARTRMTHAFPEVKLESVYAIRYKTSGGETKLCTGTQLDSQHVLTAGHCGCGDPSTYVLSNSPDLRQRKQASAVEVGIIGVPILFDQRWCSGGGAFGKDLALLRTSKVLPPRGDTKLTRTEEGTLPWSNLTTETRVGAGLVAVGYGYTETGEIGRRMKAEVPVVTRDCAERIWWRYCAPFEEFVLAADAGSSRPSDSCGGDSGGPVIAQVWMSEPKITNVTREVSHDPALVLVGVTSRAAPFAQPYSDQHCGGGGIYTIISRNSVMSWLSTHGVKFSFLIQYWEKLPENQ